MYPWLDPSGRFSFFKLAVFVALLVPGIVLLWPVIAEGGATIPVKEAILQSGEWTIRILLITLLVTPLRRITRFSKLVQVRRQVGVAAFCYVVIHFGLYAISQNLDVGRIASEIVLRIYLTIGFVALIGLAVLTATSTKSAMRRLGAKWGRLHKLVYPIAVLGVVHFFLQSKVDVSEATLMAGMFVGLMLYRFAHWRGWSLRSTVTLSVIAVIAGLATAGIEYAWYALATGIPADRVVAANLEWMWPLRPAWNVVLAGVAISVISLFGRDKPARSWIARLVGNSSVTAEASSR
ncbi:MULTISPECIES: protein-methionine-sulfoxide reductase heme-binding subunit MsrQ [unclassified Thalassospira]|uniref:sulfite oxidase heme-binding subunit YedZ n=1 Tax=unclassified Thalassospira TaxID=2648997 RepID=UPI0018CF7881|nr:MULTISPECIES: protein-methionine-sulfoxide reductase heme-binding subunit MsrQ [unclassified Thalassospira]QPO10222.1 sulfoxide reductase heme-binding subunit YedZ [Thalassospira sp. A40-3]|tara:strand:+ start:278 stop:1156 length:879 start_codon:yes stop_codon:yes gene_type:complete